MIDQWKLIQMQSSFSEMGKCQILQAFDNQFLVVYAEFSMGELRPHIFEKFSSQGRASKANHSHHPQDSLLISVLVSE